MQLQTEKGKSATLFYDFENCTFTELEAMLYYSKSRKEKAFYRTLVNLKLQMEQEKVIGEPLI